MKRYCLTLDLKNDDLLIAEYDEWHSNVWPSVTHSILSSGIKKMAIYRVSNRLFMIMETTSDFSFEKKKNMDLANERVQEWEKLMWDYQQPLPFAEPGEKWVMMKKIFSL